MSDRKLLGANLPMDERVQLAQLASQPGWAILVRLMAEACRLANEEVIKLDPVKVERYSEKLAALQMSARAVNKFSAEVLDSVKMHHNVALKQIKDDQELDAATNTRFKGFRAPTNKKPEVIEPVVESPTEGAQENQ